MNKRQAKIEALWLASGILSGVDAICLHLPEGDQKKIEVEFDKIVSRLTKRATALATSSNEVGSEAE